MWTTTNKCPHCQGKLPWPAKPGVDDCSCPHCGASFKFASGVYGMLMAALEPLVKRGGGSIPADAVPGIAELLRGQSLAGDDRDAKRMLNELSVAGLLKVRLERPKNA